MSVSFDPTSIFGFLPFSNEPVQGKDEIDECDECYIIKYDGIGTLFQQFHGKVPHVKIL